VLTGAFGADAYNAVRLIILILRFGRFAASLRTTGAALLTTHYSLLTTHYFTHYSVLKLFTGLDTAALIA
jgi:hypothetical protein